MKVARTSLEKLIAIWELHTVELKYGSSPSPPKEVGLRYVKIKRIVCPLLMRRLEGALRRKAEYRPGSHPTTCRAL